MNKKVSLVLRIVAILVAAAAVTLYFLVKGQLENAMVKTKPIDTVLSNEAVAKLPLRSEKPRNQTSKTLEERVAKSAAVQEVVEDLLDTKVRNEKTIAANKATIAAKSEEIDNLKNELDAKTEEANQLLRDKEALSSEVSGLNSKVSELENQLRSEKERVAQLTEEKSNMYTKEEYDQKLAEIEELQKTKAAAGRRYARFRTWVVQRGESVPSEFPVDLYSEAKGGVVIEFEPDYVLTKVVALDHVRGQIVVGVGAENEAIRNGDMVVLSVDDERVAEAKITDARTSKAVLGLVPGAQLNKLTEGTFVKIIPVISKKAKE